MSDLAHDTADDAFHEIQLSGKQLVFLFMATTVVSVVIFLCGVLVGRGVRVEGAGRGDVQTQDASPAAPLPGPAGSAPAAADTPAPTAEAPLSYPNRLGSEAPVQERLKPQADPAATAPARSEPASSPAPAPAPPVRADGATRTAGAGAPDTASTTPVRSGTWVVQVQALRDQSEAAAIARRLTAKGYPAFVVNPDAKEPAGMYRVHVGRYNDRAEAERVAARLQQEEKFSPWVRR